MQDNTNNTNTFENQVNTLQSGFDTEIKNLINILVTNNDSLGQEEFFAKEGDEKGADAEKKINYEAVNKKSLDLLAQITTQITDIGSNKNLSNVDEINQLVGIQKEHKALFGKLNSLGSKANKISELKTPEDQKESEGAKQLESLEKLTRDHIWLDPQKNGEIGKAKKKFLIQRNHFALMSFCKAMCQKPWIRI